MAFEFQQEARFIGEMLLYLRRREACEPRELPIRIEGIGEARALVYIYAGGNLMAEGRRPEQLADMGVGTSGENGPWWCIRHCGEAAALGIHDRWSSICGGR
jgi:hypothetical protein